MEWRDVPNYEGIYKVSSDGKVMSANGIRKAEMSQTGYWRISLWNKGKEKHFFIHRLVAMAFIPNPNNYDLVNHIDGNKLNNNVENLEWCNLSQNVQHAYRTGLVHPATTKVIQYTKDFVKVKEWNSIREACEELKLNHANIVTVCGQKTNRRQCGGFIWRYAKEN